MKTNSNSKADNEVLKLIAQSAKRLRKIYEDSINELSLAAGKITFNGEVFDLKKHPTLARKMESALKKMRTRIYTMLVNDIQNSWGIANNKNNLLVDKRLAGRKLSGKNRQLFYDPNLEALSRFINRKESGLNLSDRVWNLLESHRVDLERGLSLGISKGQSAKEMATELKKNLNEPDRLFRRVRDEEGNLKLSKAAKEYHPGQGVYRSSFKNAFRLTRTETNMSYRMSDFERWQKQPFVVGVEIRLSDNHPKFDICDLLAGKYPKWFNWTGWHPQCMCYVVPIMMTDEEFDRYVDLLAEGKEVDFVSVNAVTKLPEQFTQYLQDNAEKLKGLKNKPYWMRDNEEAINSIFDNVTGNQNTSQDPPQTVRSFNTKSGLDSNIAAAKTDKVDSLQFYSDKKNNVLLPRRQALHDKIVDDFLEKGSTKTGYNYMLGGATANGKSTLVESGFLPHPKGILKLDPDEIKGKLPEYNRMLTTKDSTAAAFVHEESSMLNKRIQREAISRKMDTLTDGIADGTFEKLAAKVEALKQNGQKVRIDYVTLDTDLSLQLAEARAVRTGRHVPRDYVLEMNKEIAILVPKLVDAKTFDELYLWDTNVNGNPRLILTQINGELKIHSQELYDRFLDKAKRK